MNGVVVRVSLRTRDEVEAKRIYYRFQERLLDAHPATSEDLKHLLVEVVSTVRSTANVVLSSTKISSLFESYASEKLRDQSWRESTEVLARDQFKLLTDISGDLTVKEVSNATVNKVKTTLQKLPAHARKKPAYRHLTVHQLTQRNIPESDLMSVSTINMKLSLYAEVWNWAVRHGYAYDNPFNGVQLKDPRKLKALRLPFSIDQLKQIFSSTRITQPTYPYRYWVPLLALYTGARINELCQLHRDDIDRVDGVLCLQIAPTRSGQSLKNHHSERLVPVHDDVLSAGFEDFVSNQTGMIFPELTPFRGKYSYSASKWFSRIKPKLLPDSDSRHCFHSFRHSFIDHLTNTQNLGSAPAVKRLVGHVNNDITTGRYGGDVGVSRLHEVIQMQDWQTMGVHVPAYKP